MDRRRFVKLAGMASVAATGGLAGCQGGGDGTETPGSNGASGAARYNKWVYEGAIQNNEVFAVSLDWQTAASQENEQTTTAGSQNLEEDVLAATPASWLFVGAFAIGFGVSQLGLDTATEEDGPTEFAHIASGGIVLEGSYDTESLSESVEQAGGSEVEEHNGYTVYETSGSRNAVVALSGDAIVVVQGSSDDIDDPVARAKAIVDSGAGDKTLLSDSSGAFNDVVTAFPNRTVMGGVYSTEPEPLNQSSGDDETAQTGFARTDLGGEVDALASSTEISQSGMTSAIAIHYTSESEVNDKSAIEAAVGNMGDNQTVTIDGQLVTVEAEYDRLPSIN